MPNWLVIMQAVVAAMQALAPEVQAIIKEITDLINNNQPVPPARLAQLQQMMGAHAGLVMAVNAMTAAAGN